jgi:hypothetical protein
MDILSMPLRFSNTGDFIKVDDDSNAYKAEQIKAFMSTHKNERKMFPTFGVDDPTFGAFDPASLLGEFIQFYGSSIQLQNVDVIRQRGALDTIEVNFT